MDSVNATLEAAKQMYGKGVIGLQNLKWEDIPEPARNYIEAHPKLTAMQLVLVLLTCCPWLVATPLLSLAGFSGIGPVAGSFAAVFQSANGATGAFSVLQSAAMGGYGAAAVNGIVQAPSMLATGVAEFFKWRNPTSGGAS